MDSDLVADLCASLSLDWEASPEIAISDEQRQLEVLRLKHCLVGRVLFSKLINREGFKTTILWHGRISELKM